MRPTTSCEGSSPPQAGLPMGPVGRSAPRTNPFASNRFDYTPAWRVDDAHSLGGHCQIVTDKIDMHTVFGGGDPGDRHAERHALQWDRVEQRRQQGLRTELGQVDASDRDLRIAQCHGLLLDVQSWRTADYGFDVAAENPGLDHELYPAIAAVGHRCTSKRRQFRVVQQSGAFGVTDGHRFEPVIGSYVVEN